MNVILVQTGIQRSYENILCFTTVQLLISNFIVSEKMLEVARI